MPGLAGRMTPSSYEAARLYTRQEAERWEAVVRRAMVLLRANAAASVTGAPAGRAKPAPRSRAARGPRGLRVSSAGRW